MIASGFVFIYKRIPMKSVIATTASLHVVFWLACTSLALPIAAQPAAQNLVQNPGFEAIGPGRTVRLDNQIAVAAGWSAPNRGSSQLFTTHRDYIYDPHGSLWPFKARSGKNVAGMNVYGDDDGALRREYIQGTLTKPLTVGKKYVFEFWVHYHCEGANNIGIVFLPERIRDTTSGLLHFQPVSFQKLVTKYNSDEDAWTPVRDSFVAAMPFQNFIIGNFFHDSLTQIEGNTYDHHFAYIDDIRVVEVQHQQATTSSVSQEDQNKWRHNAEKSKGMSGTGDDVTPDSGMVYFKYDSAKITPEAAAILDGIAARWAGKADVKIELRGYASSEGKPDYNRRLSHRRNLNVSRYLAAKGVHVSRISMNAYGENDPVSPNDTEENREKNRRVAVLWKLQ